MEDSRRDLSAEEEVIKNIKVDRRKRRLGVLRGRIKAMDKVKGGRISKGRELGVVGKLGYRKDGGEMGVDTAGQVGRSCGELKKDVLVLDAAGIRRRDFIHLDA